MINSLWNFLFAPRRCKHKECIARRWCGDIFRIHCKKCGQLISKKDNPLAWETVTLYKNKEDYDL